MSAVLLAASLMVIAGGVASVAGRRPLHVALGIGVLLAAAPLVSDPGSPPLAFAAQAVGAVLAGEILWIGLRARRDVAGPSAVSWAPLALIAAAAFVVGVGAASGTAAGPPASLGSAMAVLTIGVAAAVRPDPVRRGLAAVLLVSGAELVRVAIAGNPSPLEAAVAAALGVVLCACVALIAGTLPGRPDAELE